MKDSVGEAVTAVRKFLDSLDDSILEYIEAKSLYCSGHRPRVGDRKVTLAVLNLQRWGSPAIRAVELAWRRGLRQACRASLPPRTCCRPSRPRIREQPLQHRATNCAQTDGGEGAFIFKIMDYKQRLLRALHAGVPVFPHIVGARVKMEVGSRHTVLSGVRADAGSCSTLAC